MLARRRHCPPAATAAAASPSLIQTATLLLLNACLVGCILVCLSLLFVPIGLPAELLPHIVGLLLLAAALAFSVNYLVALTGTVSPEAQQRELFGDPQAGLLTTAGSSSAPDLQNLQASPPAVEQPLAPLAPELAAAEAAAESKDKDL